MLRNFFELTSSTYISFLGKNKSVLFERALSVAQMENDRPIESRMDWNHQGVPQTKMTKSKLSNSVSSPSVDATNQPSKKKQKTLNDQSGGKSKKISRVSSSSSITGVESRNVSHNVNRKNMSVALGSLIDDPTEDGPLVCKILRKLPLALGNSYSSGGLEFSNNVGFITLPSRQSATFACIRRAMENELDEDCFSKGEDNINDSNIGAAKWKFYVPKLGPVSVKQEKSIGPVLDFLKGTANDSLIGNGTPSNPLKIIFTDC